MSEALAFASRRGLLMVAYYFPPLGGMGSIRAARFVRHLPDLGWGPMVVTPRQGMYHRLGRQWVPPPGAEVTRTASVELSRLARRAFSTLSRKEPLPEGELTPVQAGPLGSTLRALLREFVYIPDSHLGWFPFAVRTGSSLVRQKGPPLVYTSSVPFTSHLVGRTLKRRHGLVWVAEFRDLWTGSQAGEPRTAVRRAVNRWLESKIVKEADAVVVTAPAARTLLAELHPEVEPARIHVVTNGFDASDHPPPAPPDRRGPLVLVHAGTLIPQLQDPTPLLAAAAALARSQPGSVRIRAFGPKEPWLDAMSRSGAPESVLDLPGLVTPAVIPAALSRCSAVLILAPGSGFNSVYLGKMFEWLGSGLPALAVVDPAGAMASVMQRSGGAFIVPRNDAGVLKDALEGLLREHRQGTLGEQCPDRAVAHEFEVTAITKKLADVFVWAMGRAIMPSDPHDSPALSQSWDS